MKKILLMILTTIVLSSCHTTTYFIDGKYRLKEANSNHTSLGIHSNNTYSDEYVTLSPSASVSGSQIDLTIVNNHSSSIRILWDDAAFIDNEGSSHRIIHMGIKLIDKEKAQVPSVIPAGARLEDTIAPVDGLTLIDGNWSIALPNYNKFDNMNSAENTLQLYKTNPYYTETKLLLPIEIDGKKIEYTLTFVGSEFNIQSMVEYDNPRTLYTIYAIGGISTILTYVVAMATL